MDLHYLYEMHLIYQAEWDGNARSLGNTFPSNVAHLIPRRFPRDPPCLFWPGKINALSTNCKQMNFPRNPVGKARIVLRFALLAMSDSFRLSSGLRDFEDFKYTTIGVFACFITRCIELFQAFRHAQTCWDSL